MTDAREIIAEKIQEFRDPSPDGYISGVTYSFADDLMDALTAAGYRILGPDEVDPVTVEKAAEVAERDAVDGSVRLDPKRHKNLSDWFAEQRASAIRALGRKA